MGTFLTGALAGYGIAIPLGPITVLPIQVGIRRGWTCAASAAAGAATADLTFAIAAVASGAAVAGLIESVEGPFRILSALVLVIAVAVLWVRGANSLPWIRTCRGHANTPKPT